MDSRSGWKCLDCGTILTQPLTMESAGCDKCRRFIWAMSVQESLLVPHLSKILQARIISRDMNSDWADWAGIDKEVVRSREKFLMSVRTRRVSKFCEIPKDVTVRYAIPTGDPTEINKLNTQYSFYGVTDTPEGSWVLPTRFLWWAIWKPQPFRELVLRGQIMPGTATWTEWRLSLHPAPGGYQLLAIRLEALEDHKLLVAKRVGDGPIDQKDEFFALAGKRILVRSLEDFF